MKRTKKLYTFINYVVCKGWHPGGQGVGSCSTRGESSDLVGIKSCPPNVINPSEKVPQQVESQNRIFNDTIKRVETKKDPPPKKKDPRCLLRKHSPKHYKSTYPTIAWGFKLLKLICTDTRMRWVIPYGNFKTVIRLWQNIIPIEMNVVNKRNIYHYAGDKIVKIKYAPNYYWRIKWCVNLHVDLQYKYGRSSHNSIE